MTATSAPAADPPAPKYLTTTEAAHALGLSVRTIERHIRAGVLPAIRIGSRTRVPAAIADLATRTPV